MDYTWTVDPRQVTHPTAATAFDSITTMWCAVVLMSSGTRLAILSGGDKDTIYALNRAGAIYYGETSRDL